MTRYYLGMPILVVSALEGWVLGYDLDKALRPFQYEEGS